MTYRYDTHPPMPVCDDCGADIDPDDYDDPMPSECRTCQEPVEIVCSRGHCWVPDTPILNAAGGWGGGALQRDLCPACGDTPDSPGWHVYRGGQTT